MARRTPAFSRRSFLHTAALTALTGILTACGPERGLPRPTPTPAPTRTIPTPTVIGVPRPWQVVSTIEKELSRPMAVTVDPSGNIYVLNTLIPSVMKFDNTSRLLLMWGSEGGGAGQFQFQVPSPRQGWTGDIAVDAAGDIYVSDANDRIQKFDPMGRFLTEWGGHGTGTGAFQFPDGLAFGQHGDLYVVDNTNHRIQRFDADGQYLGTLGTDGNHPGQFHYPLAIAVNRTGEFYVTDTGNYRIQKFDANRRFVTLWGSKGTGEGQFIYLGRIAVDVDSNVYVTDEGSQRVAKYDPNGQLLITWGATGTSQSQFSQPFGIAVDRQGNVYVADHALNRVTKFRQ